MRFGRLEATRVCAYLAARAYSCAERQVTLQRRDENWRQKREFFRKCNFPTWRLAKHLLLEGGHGEEGGHLGQHGEGRGGLLVLRQVALGVSKVIWSLQYGKMQITWGVLGGVGGWWLGGRVPWRAAESIPGWRGRRGCWGASGLEPSSLSADHSCYYLGSLDKWQMCWRCCWRKRSASALRRNSLVGDAACPAPNFGIVQMRLNKRLIWNSITVASIYQIFGRGRGLGRSPSPGFTALWVTTGDYSNLMETTCYGNFAQPWHSSCIALCTTIMLYVSFCLSSQLESWPQFP